MPEIQRPVFLAGENPALTLYLPGTDEVSAIASFWACSLTPWGPGLALILWTPDGKGAGIYTDNQPLARALVTDLVQYFPEFQGVPLSGLPFIAAECWYNFDGQRYEVACQAPGEHTAEAAWAGILDRKLVRWPGFPAGPARYDLSTVICPCREAEVWLDGQRLPGQPQLGQTAEGTPGSSAFMAFGETWLGPNARVIG